MDEKEIATLEISKLLIKGLEDEAMASKEYFGDLAEIERLNQTAQLDEVTMSAIRDSYAEIIADEQNHAQKFFALCVEVSGIEPNKD